MKNQVSDFMKEADVAAILISGAQEHNPSLRYYVGDVLFTQADVLLTQNEAPLLFYRVMERDNAKKTGMQCVCYNELQERLGYKPGCGSAGRAQEIKAMLNWAGIHKGRVAFCGRVEFGSAYDALKQVGESMPEITVIGGEGDAILQKARFTKDAEEIERIRQMSTVVTTIVGRVEDFISTQCLQNGRLVDQNGKEITIGRIKSMINLWLGELGAENPEGTIFSMGADAGVPHNGGDPEEVLQAGKPIVFDFFPCGLGGGYFSDFTRTWCIGYAPDSVKNAYQEVKTIHDELINRLTPGMHFEEAQKWTCEFFHSHGHDTVAEKPHTMSGYVHSVGHGLGLNIHERPFSGSTADPADNLLPGTVFTIEPGLYYPDGADGYGVRIEDTLYMDEQGKPQYLTHYPYNLIINMKGSIKKL